ncbi:unnamed protein product [Anisakis simplex]|uniref:Uncharacterized protein n=1 Tax=Anisakis simplex TaxID=6269 RepID=A0A0M3J1X1_ANISI|nr:unnamed protein product [Anisakis simplex]
MMRRCSVVLIDSVYTSRIAFLHRHNFIRMAHCNCLRSTSQSAIRYNDVKKSDLLDQNKFLYSTDSENGTKPAEGKDVISSNESNLPTKELLFQIDWLFEVLVRFLSSVNFSCLVIHRVINDCSIFLVSTYYSK